MSFKLELTPAGVNALRTWADSIPFVLTSVEESTQKIMNTVISQEGLGVHADAFREMFLLIESFKNDLYYVVEEIPTMLNKTADKIECYIYNIDYDDQGTEASGWQRVRRR